jgi:hypothetical protein
MAISMSPLQPLPEIKSPLLGPCINWKVLYFHTLPLTHRAIHPHWAAMYLSPAYANANVSCDHQIALCVVHVRVSLACGSSRLLIATQTHRGHGIGTVRVAAALFVLCAVDAFSGACMLDVFIACSFLSSDRSSSSCY